MIIVPELKTTFILVPRTGTGALYRELIQRYPKSMLLYRHMEADGIPQGYDRWHKIGVVRHPYRRLYSLYKFQKNFGGGAIVQGGSASDDAQRLRKQVEGRSFYEWLTENDQPFTTPADSTPAGEFWPVLSKRNPAPENKRSQWTYLRPDLGTEIVRFQDLRGLFERFDLNPNFTYNVTDPGVEVDQRAFKHVEQYCAWDMEQECWFL